MIIACPAFVDPALTPSLPRMTSRVLCNRLVRNLQAHTHALSVRTVASAATQTAAAAETEPTLVRQDVGPEQAAQSSQHSTALRQDRITMDGRFIASPLPAPEQPSLSAPPLARLSAYAPNVPPISEEVSLVLLPSSTRCCAFKAVPPWARPQPGDCSTDAVSPQLLAVHCHPAGCAQLLSVAGDARPMMILLSFSMLCVSRLELTSTRAMQALGFLVEFLQANRNVVALTGAGVSTESSIPDYRGPRGAYSTGFKPMTHQQVLLTRCSIIVWGGQVQPCPAGALPIGNFDVPTQYGN